MQGRAPSRRGPLGNDDGRARLGHSSHTVAQYGNGCRDSQDVVERPGNTLTGMDHYAPLPTDEQLDALGRELGRPTRFDRRIVGGLGGTVDVLIVGTMPGERVVLKRYWLPEPGEISPAESEFRALALAADRGISAPSPIWIDRSALFPERAIVISYVEGGVLLEPTDPNDWASQLAVTRSSEIHRIQPASTDQDLFPLLANTDGHHSEAETLEALRSTRSAWSSGQDVRRSSLPWSRRLRSTSIMTSGRGTRSGSTRISAAVIDWEGGAIADPALDVAYCALDMRLLGLTEAAAGLSSRSTGTLRTDPRESALLGVARPLSRPMPDIAIWVPGWQSMGVEISVDEARLRHTALITAALE